MEEDQSRSIDRAENVLKGLISATQFADESPVRQPERVKGVPLKKPMQEMGFYCPDDYMRGLLGKLKDTPEFKDLHEKINYFLLDNFIGQAVMIEAFEFDERLLFVMQYAYRQAGWSVKTWPKSVIIEGEERMLPVLIFDNPDNLTK